MNSADLAFCILSDDELVALAHSQQRHWARPLATVNVSSQHDLTAAVARGYRSLLLRGYLDDDNAAGAELLLPLSLVGTKPGIMATWVSRDLAQAPGAERFELFANECGEFIAATTRPGGVHTFAAIEGREGLSFFADMALAHQVGPGPDDQTRFCVLVRGADEHLVGGFVVDVGNAIRLAPDDLGGMTETTGPGVSPTAEAWRGEIGALLNSTDTQRGRALEGTSVPRA